MVWLARLAEQSRRAAIGTATLVLPWYPPAVAAKQLADIDRSCRGRLILGVGAGGEYADDFAAASVPIGERSTRLDESIDLLRRFWSGEPIDHEGRHFHYDKLRIHPPPTQREGPPIVVSGRREGAMRRAARRGDGWMPYLYSPERYRGSVSFITEEAAARGRALDNFQWMVYVMVAVDEDAAVARRTVLEFRGATYDQDFSRFVERVTVAGTLEQVVDRLGAFVQAGVRHLILLPCSASQSGGTGRPWFPELLTMLRERHGRR